MDARVWLVAGAVLVLVAVALVVRMVLERAATGERARAMRGFGGGVLQTRALRETTSLLMRRVPRVNDWATAASAAAERRGVQVTAAEAVAWLMCGVAGACLGGVALGGRVAWGIAAAAALVAVAFCGVAALSQRDEAAWRAQAPEIVQAIARNIEAGASLEQTFARVGQETPGTMGRMFQTAAHVLKSGGSVQEAIDGLLASCTVQELRFLLVALDVQHKAGGGLAAVLEAVDASVRQSLDLQRALETQTTQARLSARIVTLLPFGLLMVLQLMSPGFIDPLFGGPAGWAILTLALLMQVSGVLLVRRILKEAQ